VRPNDGDLIAFAGDSITEHLVAVSGAMETQVAELPPVGSAVRVDRHENRGWASLLIGHITIAFPDLNLRFLNAGRGGDTSRLLLGRLTSDVLVHRPAWCLLSVGVVDVRRTFQPDRSDEAVALDEYRANLLEITNRLQGAGSQVVLLEPTPHSRPPTGADDNVTTEDVNRLTATYAEAMSRIADLCGVSMVRLLQPLLDLESRLRARSPSGSIYADEVHLGPVGDLKYSQSVFEFLRRAWRET
jgi:lysophospholipase L1-like esterase